MIIHDLDDLILEQDDGEAAVEELGRSVLSEEGAWTVIAYLIRTRIGDEPWRGPFLWLHRYQKVNQGWKLVSRFKTTEPKQFEKLAKTLQKWDQEFSS